MDELNDAAGVPVGAQDALERAYTHRDRDELHDALRACDAALALDPGLAEAHNLRGMLLEELGRGGEALAAYRDAIRLDPELTEAQENLREAQEELGEGGLSSLAPEELVFPPGERLSWGETWTRVLTRPSVASFERVLRDPQASAKRAYTWVFFGALIGNLFSWCGVILVSRGNADVLGAASEVWGGSLLCAPPQALMAGLGAILGLAIRAGITQWIARALGGRGKFPQLAYATAAYLAPLTITMGAVSAIPYVNLLILPLAISGLVLNVMAVKAVNRFGWGEAIVASLAPSALLLIPIIVIAILLLLGPVIGEIFSNIVECV
jgi:tetratricopeptide (TPR) repeat protein